MTTAMPDTLPPLDWRRSFRDAIVAWFRTTRRSLPFRDDATPYRVWVSEVMAQQTRIDTVVPYFERFVARFPSVEVLAAAPLDDVLALWSGLGYYGRARNLHRAAGEVVRRFDGELPRDPALLRELPGIGEYTAGAIASIAFGVPVPVLDGNVTRVLARAADLDSDVTRTEGRRWLWALAGALVPVDDPRSLNEGLMELGALICTPTSPSCSECPVADLCEALARGTVASRPRKGTKSPVPTVLLQGAVVQRADGALLLVQNPPSGLFGGLWVVPQHPRELPRRRAAPLDDRELARALAGTLGVAVAVESLAGRVEHVLSHRRLVVQVHRCRAEAPVVRPSGYASHRWVASEGELDDMGISTLTRKVLAIAREGRGGEV